MNLRVSSNGERLNGTRFEDDHGSFVGEVFGELRPPGLCQLQLICREFFEGYID